MPQLGADALIDRVVKDVSSLVHRKVKYVTSKDQTWNGKGRIKIERDLSENDKKINALLKQWRLLKPRASQSYRSITIPAGASELKGIGDLYKLVNHPGVAPSLLSAAIRAVKLDVLFRRAEADAARFEIRILLDELYHCATYYQKNRAIALRECADVVACDIGKQSYVCSVAATAVHPHCPSPLVRACAELSSGSLRAVTQSSVVSVCFSAPAPLAASSAAASAPPLAASSAAASAPPLPASSDAASAPPLAASSAAASVPLGGDSSGQRRCILLEAVAASAAACATAHSSPVTIHARVSIAPAPSIGAEEYSDDDVMLLPEQTIDTALPSVFRPALTTSVSAASAVCNDDAGLASSMRSSTWCNSDTLVAKITLQRTRTGSLLPLYTDSSTPVVLVSDILMEGRERSKMLHEGIQRGLTSILEGARDRVERLGEESIRYLYRAAQHLSDVGVLPGYVVPATDADFRTGSDPRQFLRDPSERWRLITQSTGKGGRRKQESYIKRESARSRYQQQLESEVKRDLVLGDELESADAYDRQLVMGVESLDDIMHELDRDIE